MLQKIKNAIPYLFNPDDEVSTPTSVITYVTGAFILLCCGLKLFSGLENKMDIQFADEAAYIRFGLDLYGKLNRDWGPLYAIWYKLLSYINSDTIALYYLNYKITGIAISILLYLFLIRIKTNSLLAFLVAYCILISATNVSVWPRISNFCIILCLISLLCISFIKNNIYKFSVFAITCLLCSYARPEFYISFLLAAIATFICIFINRKKLVKIDAMLLVSLAVITIFLHLFFRFPSNNFFGYNRGVAAFYQHYAFNFKWRTGAQIDAWLYWEEICKKTFGDCNSMWCVIKTQPGIFISNTLFNIKNYFLFSLVSITSYFLPVDLMHYKKIQTVLLLFFVGIVLFLVIKKKYRASFIEQISATRFYVLVLAFFVFPSVLSCVFVFPRQHYILLQMLFFVVVIVAILNSSFEKIKFKSFYFLPIGIALFFITPNINSYTFLKVNTSVNNLCNKELTNYLAKNFAIKEHTIFTNMPFVRGMLPLNFKEVNTIFDKKKNTPFTHYLDSAKIDIVIVNPTLTRDPHITTDSTWLSFYQDFEKYHFKKVQYNSCETYLLVKQAE